MASVRCGVVGISIVASAILFVIISDGTIKHLVITTQMSSSGLFKKPMLPSLEEVLSSRELNGRPLDEVPQDDPLLVDFIKKRLLVSPNGRPYNLDKPARKEFSQVNQTAVLLKLMSRSVDLRPGFFVECGAFNGETFSNTLYFERERGWSGLLIEPDAANFQKLVAKNRRAHAIRACLSTKPHPMVITLVAESSGGGISEYWSKFKQDMKTKVRRYTALCVPLYSALLAVNTTTVDYFSLDVERAEMPVLKTIPFDKIDIRLLSVEYGIYPVPSPQFRKQQEATRKAEMNHFFANMSRPRYNLAAVGPYDLFYVKSPSE